MLKKTNTNNCIIVKFSRANNYFSSLDLGKTHLCVSIHVDSNIFLVCEYHEKHNSPQDLSML